MIPRMPATPSDKPTSSPQGDPAEREALETARDVLTTDGESVLRADEHSYTIRYILDPAGGRLIAAAAAAVFDVSEPVLYVPSESDDALALIVSIRHAEESALTDRWQAWHGPPDFPRWAAIAIESGKHGAWVFDASDLVPPHPLAGVEAALCRHVNGRKDALARLCERSAHVSVPSPLCVGIDDLGLHVRARFGIVRIHFDRPPRDADDAKALIESMLAAR